MVAGCSPDIIGILNPVNGGIINDDCQVGGNAEVGSLFYFVTRNGLFYIIIIFYHFISIFINRIS